MRACRYSVCSRIMNKIRLKTRLFRRPKNCFFFVGFWYFLQILKFKILQKNNQQAKNTGGKRVIKIQNVSFRGHEKLLKDVKLAKTRIYFNLIAVVMLMDQNTFSSLLRICVTVGRSHPSYSSNFPMRLSFMKNKINLIFVYIFHHRRCLAITRNNKKNVEKSFHGL